MNILEHLFDKTPAFHFWFILTSEAAVHEYSSE